MAEEKKQEKKNNTKKSEKPEAEKKEKQTESKEKQTEEKKQPKKNIKKAPEFKGEYIKTLGRRKKSVAQVRMYKEGSGQVVVNGISADDYFKKTRSATVFQPIKLTSAKDFDFSILVKGGGKGAQCEACRHGIARALVAFDEEYKLPIKAKGWMTRDPRRVERKKPGLKKARRSPQWSKR